MKNLNHYLQKISLKSIAIILVATMLLTIPRMNVYSVIGSYQRTSMAITANNNFQLHKLGDNETLIVPSFLEAAFLVVIGALAFVGISAGAVALAVDQCKGEQYPIYPDHINYSKYNFSQFDNTIVR